MKIHYHPDTDSLTIHLKDGPEGIAGEIMGEDLNENIVLHRDDAGVLYEIEVYGNASREFDLARLEVVGKALNETNALHGDNVAVLTKIDFYGIASPVFPLARLEAEGWPIRVSPAGGQESRASKQPPEEPPLRRVNEAYGPTPEEIA